jgi:hypothetical protein
MKSSPMKKSDIVIAGADQLFVTEDAVDQALTEAGRLISTLTGLRVNANVSAVVGQPAVEAILDATTHLGAARRSMVTAHAHLAEVKIQLGCRTTLVGTGQDKPLDGDIGGAVPKAAHAANV